MPTITTPRPPLNLFNVSRISVPSSYATILDVPSYLIPVNGPNPARPVQAVALLTSLIVANNGPSTIQFSIRVLDASNVTWTILNQMDIPPNDFALIELGKQNLPSGDRLQLKCESGQAATASLSYVLNQREEYTVIP
jgi:spore coat protein U-like protein